MAKPTYAAVPLRVSSRITPVARGEARRVVEAGGANALLDVAGTHLGGRDLADLEHPDTGLLGE
jgi:hypothetical protein